MATHTTHSTVGPVQVPNLPPVAHVNTQTQPAPLSERDRLTKMTLKELKEYAKEHNIRGYSQKNKADLVDLILAGSAPGGTAGGAPTGAGTTATAVTDIQKMTIPQLKEEIKKRGGRGYSGKSKAELVKMLGDMITHASAQ